MWFLHVSISFYDLWIRHFNAIRSTIVLSIWTVLNAVQARIQGSSHIISTIDIIRYLPNTTGVQVIPLARDLNGNTLMETHTLSADGRQALKPLS